MSDKKFYSIVSVLIFLILVCLIRAGYKAYEPTLIKNANINNALEYVTNNKDWSDTSALKAHLNVLLDCVKNNEYTSKAPKEKVWATLDIAAEYVGYVGYELSLSQKNLRLHYLNLAGKNGEPRAIIELFDYYRKSGPSSEYAKYTEKAVGIQHPEAYVSLGSFYEAGIHDYPQNYEKALDYYAKAEKLNASSASSKKTDISALIKKHEQSTIRKKNLEKSKNDTKLAQSQKLMKVSLFTNYDKKLTLAQVYAAYLKEEIAPDYSIVKNKMEFDYLNDPLSLLGEEKFKTMANNFILIYEIYPKTLISSNNDAELMGKTKTLWWHKDNTSIYVDDKETVNGSIAKGSLKFHYSKDAQKFTIVASVEKFTKDDRRDLSALQLSTDAKLAENSEQSKQKEIAETPTIKALTPEIKKALHNNFNSMAKKDNLVKVSAFFDVGGDATKKYVSEENAIEDIKNNKSYEKYLKLDALPDGAILKNNLNINFAEDAQKLLQAAVRSGMAEKNIYKGYILLIYEIYPIWDSRVTKNSSFDGYIKPLSEIPSWSKDITSIYLNDEPIVISKSLKEYNRLKKQSMLSSLYFLYTVNTKKITIFSLISLYDNASIRNGEVEFNINGRTGTRTN